VDICAEDVIYGERGSCTNCPIARALRRLAPAGMWEFDGDFARNPMYGTFCLLQRVRWDSGTAAITTYDVCATLTVLRLVMVRCGS